MIDTGQARPGGDHANLRWIVGPIEDVALTPPYSLIMSGDSLHWMDWYRVMPRLATMLSPNGLLAILGVEPLPRPWEDELWKLRRRFSVIPQFQAYDLVTGLEDRGLFRRIGTERTGPETFRQTLDEYIESFHGRAGCAKDRMTSEQVTAFDDAVRALAAPHVVDYVEMRIVSTIVWGEPLQLPR